MTTVALILAQLMLIGVILLGITFQFRDHLLLLAINSGWVQAHAPRPFSVQTVRTSLWGPIALQLGEVETPGLKIQRLVLSWDTDIGTVIRQSAEGRLSLQHEVITVVEGETESQDWPQAVSTISAWLSSIANWDHQTFGTEHDVQVNLERFNFNGLQWTGWILFSPDQKSSGIEGHSQSPTLLNWRAQLAVQPHSDLKAEPGYQHTVEANGSLDPAKSVVQLSSALLQLYGFKLKASGEYDSLNSKLSGAIELDQMDLKNLVLSVDSLSGFGLASPPEGELKARLNFSQIDSSSISLDFNVKLERGFFDFSERELTPLTKISGPLEGSFELRGSTQIDLNKGELKSIQQALWAITAKSQFDFAEAELSFTKANVSSHLVLSSEFLPIEINKPPGTRLLVRLKSDPLEQTIRAWELQVLLSNLSAIAKGHFSSTADKKEDQISTDPKAPFWPLKLQLEIPQLSGWEKLIASLSRSDGSRSLAGQIQAELFLREPSAEASVLPPIELSRITFERLQVAPLLIVRPRQGWVKDGARVGFSFAGSGTWSKGGLISINGNFDSLKALGTDEDALFRWPGQMSFKVRHPASTEPRGASLKVTEIELDSTQVTIAEEADGVQKTDGDQTVSIVARGQENFSKWISALPSLERRLKFLGFNWDEQTRSDFALGRRDRDWVLTFDNNTDSSSLQFDGRLPLSNSYLVSVFKQPARALPLKATSDAQIFLRWSKADMDLTAVWDNGLVLKSNRLKGGFKTQAAESDWIDSTLAEMALSFLFPRSTSDFVVDGQVELSKLNAPSRSMTILTVSGPLDRVVVSGLSKDQQKESELNKRRTSE